jgi:hypothetical protein
MHPRRTCSTSVEAGLASRIECGEVGSWTDFVDFGFFLIDFGLHFGDSLTPINETFG